jgi:PAS domain S-box-containing protein
MLPSKLSLQEYPYTVWTFELRVIILDMKFNLTTPSFNFYVRMHPFSSLLSKQHFFQRNNFSSYPKERKMKNQLLIPRKYLSFLIGILVFLGLYLTSLHHYLLFHSLVEIFSIAVACGIFMITWNSRRFLDNNYLLFIGIAFLFVGGLDLIHTLAYKGMGVFQGYKTNLPTQLWIAARYLEGISLFVAPLFLSRKLKSNFVFLGYTVVSTLLLLSIFYWDIFPICFLEGVGLTPFKKVSEYIICLILLASITLLLRNRREFDRNVLQWLIWSIILSIVSELAFTSYVDAYGLSNLIGHFFKIASFYLIYKAIIETGLTRPYALLFRNLKQSEERFRNIFEKSPLGIELYDSVGQLVNANKACLEIFGVSNVEKVKGFKLFEDPNLSEEVKENLKRGEAFRYEALFDFQKIKEHKLYETTQSGASYLDVLITPLGAWHKGSQNGYLVQIQNITERKRMEEDLRKSRHELETKVEERTAELAKANELLEKVFSSVDTMIAYMDKDFNFIRVNRAYAEANEREPEFYVGKNHFVLFPNEENEQIFRKVAETSEPYSVYAKPFEYAEHPERGVIHWDWSLQPIKEPDGSVGGLVLSLVNVTDRILAQEAVEAERQRFNDVLEILPAYLVLLTPDYHVPFANRFFRERFGESHGQRCFEYLFGRSEPCEICESYTSLKTMAPHKWEWTGPDGRNYDVFDFPFTDTDGSVLILEMGIDITERKRAEEALRAAHQYNRSLIEASLDPLVTINADGKIMDVNSATELTTGVPRDELIGTDFSDYFTEPEKAREGYQRVFREGFVRDYPLAIRHASGKVTDVLYHATVFRNETGVVQGVFAAARDITARKRAEEALRESENRLRLLSSQLINVQEAERKRIAREIHDSIGQILAAIKFGLESKLSQMGGGTAPSGVSIENIISLTQNGIEESRRIQMDLRPSVLDDLGILATIGWFTREFQKVYVHISVEKQISVEENEIPNSLRTVLFRVMQEAMNNVAKHSKANLIRLSLKKVDDRIELCIEDNGAGFDPETIKKGLGLTSMRERTDLSGGSFEIESVPGKGTIIRAQWPI